jgi:hypothetical protein
MRLYQQLRVSYAVPMTKDLLFDRSILHDGAATSINEDGRKLLAKAVEESVRPARPEPFPSRRIPEETITDKDLIGEPLMAWSDWSGRTTGRYFVRDGREVALRDEGYISLRRLVEKIVRVKPFSSGLSEEFIEDEIFRWWRGSLRGELSILLTTHLLAAAEGAVGEHEIMVPLSAIEIERAFLFGDVLVTPIPPALFENFGQVAIEKNPDHADTIRQHVGKLRRELGHLTAISVKVVGDREYAKKRAEKAAFDMASVLRFMCPAAVTWNVAYACFPKGAEHVRTNTLIEVRDGAITMLSQGLMDVGMFNWKLSFAELDRYMKNGFVNCAVFFGAQPLTGFQKRVQTAMAAYTRGVAANDVADRLIYAMSAAEHLLLRDEREPIQAGVGDRMAFLIAREPEHRREVVANFKKAYGLRSRQVHHLAGVDDEEVLQAFFLNMYSVLHTAMKAMSTYQERDDFLEAIDTVKFGNN